MEQTNFTTSKCETKSSKKFAQSKCIILHKKRARKTFIVQADLKVTFHTHKLNPFVMSYWAYGKAGIWNRKRSRKRKWNPNPNPNPNLRNKDWRRFCLESVTNNNCFIKTFHPHIIFIYIFIIFFTVTFFVYGAKFFFENFIYVWPLQVGIMIDMSTSPPFAAFPLQWIKHGALLRKGASKNIKVFILFRFTEFEKMLPFYKNISVQISTKRRIDWNVSTCENVKLLCLEFMLESAEEQHGLILWILVVMFFFFIKSCKLQLNILFVCLFFLVKVSKRDV